MAEKILLVQGDNLPRISFSLTDENNNNLPIDLTDATSIALKFREAGSTAVVATIPGVITNALGGLVDFLFPSVALAGEAGAYESEIEITHGSGRVLTVFRTQKYTVREQF